MLRSLLPLFLATQAVPADSPPRPDSATIATAYADEAARVIVQRAREYRRRVDQSITRYRTVGADRMTLGIRALRRERILARRESAMRIDWRRDEPSRVDVLGARMVTPMFIPDAMIPEDIDADDLMFDPTGDRLLLGVMDSSFVYHPFGANSEIHYRYASGDTTTTAATCRRSRRTNNGR